MEVEFKVNKHTNINGAGTSLVEAAGISPVEIGDVQEKTPGGWERIKTFAGLSEGVPINEYGLPEFLYRADLVPSNLNELSDDERERVLHSATIELSYREGYPTLADGRPFWARMEFEPQELYDAFDIYLNMASKYGVRGIEALTREPGINLSMQRLSEAFAYFYWAPRCKAFDLFRVAAYQKVRESRIMQTNDRHFLETERLLTSLKVYFTTLDENGNPTWLDDLTPGVAVTCLEKLVKLQRIALDLPAHGSSTPPEGTLPPNAHLEVVMRTLAQRADGDLAESRSRVTTDIDMLLDNPEAARLAQELIIKVGLQTTRRK